MRVKSAGSTSAVTGSRYLRVDEAILRVLVTRQVHLLLALEARGHAAVERIALQDNLAAQVWQGALPGALRRCREYPGWSALGQTPRWDPARQQMQETLADATLAAIVRCTGNKAP